MKTFTDENGKKYKVVGSFDTDGGLVADLQPIEKVEKKEWQINMFNPFQEIPNFAFHATVECSEPTAKAIREALKGLIDFITGGDMVLGSVADYAIDAREAYRSEAGAGSQPATKDKKGQI